MKIDSAHPALREFRHRSNRIPQAIFDRELKISWYNMSFVRAFHLEDESTETDLWDLAEFQGIERIQLIERLGDEEYGFSYHGRCMTRFFHHTTLHAEIIIMPLLKVNSEDQSIEKYVAYFYDMSSEYRRSMEDIFTGLLQASRMKDNDTGMHIERVNHFASLLAERLYHDGTYLDVTRDYVDNISFLAAMHDVGKIGIPDDVLNKEGPLDDWEWSLMKTHCLNGAYILSGYPDPMAIEIVRSHHERWDGSGYPYGLEKEMIPLSARIVTVADVYDALRSKRPYKGPLSHAQTKELILLGRGTQFDPDLIDHFAELEEQFERAYAELADVTPEDLSEGSAG